MARIEERYLQQLRDAGLYVSPPFSSTSAWADAVRVGKPISTPGNSIPGFRDSHIVFADKPQPPEMDAPSVMLGFDGTFWTVVAKEFVGGSAPSDFFNEWSGGDEAVADILSFYLGDPERMQAKADALNRTR